MKKYYGLFKAHIKYQFGLDHWDRRILLLIGLRVTQPDRKEKNRVDLLFFELVYGGICVCERHTIHRRRKSNQLLLYPLLQLNSLSLCNFSTFTICSFCSSSGCFFIQPLCFSVAIRFSLLFVLHIFTIHSQFALQNISRRFFLPF